MGIPTLILSQTADGDDNIAFTSDIDNTYLEYMFVFTDINPATDDQKFTFQVNASGESGYNEILTSQVFQLYHREDDSSQALSYAGDHDQAQATGYQKISTGVGNAADEGTAGILRLFDPSNSTFVVNFMSDMNGYDGLGSVRWFAGGYFNDATGVGEVGPIVVTGIDFKMESGAFDGVIDMYGIE